MKNIVLLIVALIFTEFCCSQEIDDYMNFDRFTQDKLSTPEVKSFEKVSLIPNDLSTGKLNLAIPIHNIQAGKLNYPISLSYNSGGIKVDEQASEVGLGWSISKTIITRKTIDGNDFDNVGTQYYDPTGGGFSNNINDPEYKAHWNARQKRMGYLLKEKLGFKATATANQTTVDEMPDIYTLISSDGFMTKFYLKDYDTPIELTEKSSIIDFLKGKQLHENPQYPSSELDPYFPMYDLFKIEITSQEGIKYTFEDFDVVISNGYSVFVSNSYDSIDGKYTVPQISTWHISKIEDLLTGEQITFEYESYNSDPVTGRFFAFGDERPAPDELMVFNSIKTVPQGGFLNDFTNCPNRVFKADFEYNDRKQYHFRAHYSRYYIKNRLKEINFPNGRVEFNWNNNRQDLYKGKSLDNIKIFGNENNDAIVKEFNFEYEYFSSGTGCSNPYKCTRLKLKSVEEVGKPPYTFTYYNENSFFPKITSNKKDFLGYYNSNINFAENERKVPNLYYYPFMDEKSISPFDISGITEKYPIYGDYDATASSLSDVRTWSLSTISYPTGATNSIQLLGENITASGLRVKSQTIRNENQVARKIDYLYTKDDNLTSSGSLVNFPYYGKPTIVLGQRFEDLRKWDQNFLHDTFIVEQHPQVDGDISKNTFVLYNNVTEKEVGNGFTTYEFLSNERHPNLYNREPISPIGPNLNRFTGGLMCGDFFVMRNSGFGTQYYTDNSFKRGELVHKEVFDDENNILKETINNYDENTSISINSFTKRLFQPNKNLSGRFVTNNDFENIFDITKDYITNTFKLRNTIEIDHFDESIDVISYYDYNSIGLISRKNKVYYNSNRNSSETQEYQYVNETSSQATGISRLKSLNQLATLVKSDMNVFESDENNYVSGFELEFNSDGFVQRIMSKNKDEFRREEMFITRYTNNGKVKEYRGYEDITFIIIWGYDNQYPIAKIENATYDGMPARVSNLISQIKSNSNIENTSAEENSLISLLNELRSEEYFANAMITTYTHDPLIGITSMTDPRGYTMYYEYDDVNRLQKVKDAQGNVLSENEYNYKNN